MDGPSPAPPSKAHTALAVSLVAILYLWVFPYHAAVNNPNENVRVYMTVAIVDDGTFAVNRIESAWGYVNDKSLRETPLSEAITQRHVSDDVLRTAGVADDVLLRFHLGHPTVQDQRQRVNLLYSSKAPGTSYLGVPAYWLLTRLTHRNTHIPPPQAAVVEPPAPAIDPTKPPVAGAPAIVRAPARRPEIREPIERIKVVYYIRLFANVLPALVFAWFWHRFLSARSTSRALGDAVFYSTMAGSSLFAYSEVFASHAHNAYCLGAAMMALCTVRERDMAARELGAEPRTHAAMMFLAGMFGAGCTMFEYPAGIATGVIALWILASNAERRRELLGVAGVVALAGAVAYVKFHNKRVAAVAAVVTLASYAATLRLRNLARLLFAGLGGAIPTALTMLYHKRCFGDALKPGYSFLENAQFRTEIAQGFFGATSFSWDAGMRIWFDPAFGLVPSTFIFLATFAGFAATLSWRPDGKLARALMRVVLGATLTFTIVKVLLAIKAHPGALAHADIGRWLVACVMALLGYLSVVLPPASRRDRSVGAATLMVCFGMTFLIGMMNNWRGGWQVGPRYLVTLVPALAIVALAGLDAIHRGLASTPALQRAVTIFAAGATVSAFLVTGLPSATFPHIPTEYVAPFFEMMLPVLRDGFVPHNAGHLLDMTGVASMWGFIGAAVVMLALVLRGDERRPLAGLAHALASLAVAMLLLAPVAAAARPEAAAVTRYVKSAWEPRPPDAPAPTGAPPANESAAHAAARARRHAEAGETGPAFDAWMRAIRATR